MRTIESVDPRGRVWWIEVPTTRRERLQGLRGRRWLPPGHGMLLRRCRSVHTFGMAFPIAAVLLDCNLRVVAVKHLGPCRLLLPRPRVRHVLECPADTDLRTGDRLRAPAGSWPGYTLSAAP